MRDDLDYEQQRRGKKGKDSVVSAAIKQALAPLVVADTLKNSALSKDTKIKDAWKKSISNYPDSAFENAIEGIEVITSQFPEFAAENPSLAALAGIGVDLADPISLAATSTKLPLTIANLPKVGTRAIFDRVADSGTEAFVKKLTKKKGMKDVPKIVDYIKKNDLRGKLRKPEELITRIDGAYDMDGKKIAEGTMDKVGQEIQRTTRMADNRGAKKINRGEIYNSRIRSIQNQNADDTVSGMVKVEPYAGKLRETIKPFRTEKMVVEGTAPNKPTTMPALPDSDLDTTISNLAKEADSIKRAKGTQAAQKAEREKAEKALRSQKVEDPKVEVSSKKAAQAKEREAAEKLTANENKKIAAENAKADQALFNLLLQRKKAFEEVSPMDLIPVPKSQKGLPPIPQKEILDIKLHNKKAATANQKYLEQDELITQLPSMEEQIEMLKSSRKPLKEVDVPPAMPDEAFEVPPALPRQEIDVPPAMPDEALGRNLEDVLAELSDAQQAKRNLGKTNAKIKGENIDAMKMFGLESKAAAPKTIKKEVARISNLEDMWRLKVDARKKLREADFDANIKNLPEHKRMVLESTQEIDNRIAESLKDINFAEGNAADIYRALNDDYGTQADFLELVVDEALNQWRGGKAKGGALPALTGAAAAAIAAKTGGASIPLSSMAGAVAGETARRGFFSSYPEIKAAIGDRMSKPLEAHLATQTATDLVAEPLARTLGITPDKEAKATPIREVETSMEDDGPVSITGEDMSPEVRKMLGGRKPQGVVEIPGAGDATDIMAPQNPIDQKMDEELAPVKPTWEPYVNEEVLNTYLPRDSKRILANPTALFAKLQQVAPNQVSIFKEMLAHDPEGLAEAAPKLAMMFPAVFEKDEYGMFDGKIADPMMQDKFLADLSSDEGMNSIEKAKLAMKVRRGESIY